MMRRQSDPQTLRARPRRRVPRQLHRSGRPEPRLRDKVLIPEPLANGVLDHVLHLVHRIGWPVIVPTGELRHIAPQVLLAEMVVDAVRRLENGERGKGSIVSRTADSSPATGEGLPHDVPRSRLAAGRQSG